MRCPECSCADDKVLETRISKTKDIIRRRRQCTGCGIRFTTQEEIIKNEYFVIKTDGRREELNRQKLLRGLQLACGKRPVSQDQLYKCMQDILQWIEKHFDREIPSEKIGELVMQNLKILDEVAYVRFASVYRRFKDKDEFIDEIKSLQENDAENG